MSRFFFSWQAIAALVLIAVVMMLPAMTEPEATHDLHIPDDPTVLSYLLSGIVQVELPRRQALLEAETTVERLEGLVSLLERELVLLTRRLRYFTPDPALLGGPRRS